MKIGFVGAGRVGFTLGKYMKEHNIDVSGYYSRSLASAKEASEFTHTGYYQTLSQLAEASDALFLTVPDGAVREVWDLIKNYSLRGKCICHCSGAMSSAVFSGIDQMQAFGYSIHPLFAVSSRLQSYREISNAYFTIEGAEQYLAYWKDFFEKLGNPVTVIQADKKVLYHSAAVFASNLVTGLFETASSLLQDCGFDGTSAAEALKTLFLNNALSVVRMGTKEALTGPVERADVKTITEHLAVLGEDEREIYIRLSKVLTHIAEQKNPQKDYNQVLGLLSAAETVHHILPAAEKQDGNEVDYEEHSNNISEGQAGEEKTVNVDGI